MKRVLRSLALVAIAVVSFSAAKAQNPRFQKVSFTETATSVSVSGKIVGLGNNQGINITLSATVSYSFDCVNPGGNQPKPFKDIVKSTTVSDQFFSAKNGSITFSLTAPKSTAEELAAEYCPNANWSIRNLSSRIISGYVTADGVGTVTY